jgi:ubiquitin-protein ligase E3 C
MMFQTFSGSSRRPRQVNLSGQEPNPFAAWGASPSASGIQKTVAVAQAERLHRQQERERLNASKRIQRTWRGHKSRKELADVRRQAWDNIEKRIDGHGPQMLPKLMGQLQLLLAFFNARNPEDISRLNRFSDRLLEASQNDCLTEKDIRPRLLWLARIILASLAG